MTVNRVACALLCLSTLFLIDCQNPPLAVGEMVPPFRLDTAADERFYLEDHKEEPVVLVFWATWCRSCKKEMAALEPLRRDPRFRDVVFAAVCTDPERREEARQIVEGLGISYTVLMDPEARLYNRFHIQALPFTMLMEPGGRLVLAQTGYDGVLIRNLEAKLLEILQK